MLIKQSISAHNRILKIMNIKSISSFEFNANQIIIDVRSPSEYAEDHIPGAINLPVLDDAEYSHVGKVYKNNSPFEASRLGSVKVSKNISGYLEDFFSSIDKNTEIIFYCARGGKRSRAFATVCKMVGWDPQIITGGYKSYRQHVVSTTERISSNLSMIILAGKTGVGKTDILEFLKSKGEAVIDLEGLANHRGSILGSSPTRKQPKQKFFETQIYLALQELNMKRPVFLEAESNKIGNLFIPGELWRTMQKAPTIMIENNLENRVTYILEEYDPDFLIKKEIPSLLSIIKKKYPQINYLKLEANLEKKNWKEFVSDLIIEYYDPLYLHSISRRRENKLDTITSDKPVKVSIPEISLEICSIKDKWK